MGSGYHGGFGSTQGSQKKNCIFTPVQFEGTVKVNGIERDVSRRVYQRNDIDFNYVDKNTGQTNLHRMLKGNAPYGHDGKPLELYHILQKEAGPMVEIQETTHMEYKRILHGLRGANKQILNTYKYI
ncbi:MAG: HNH/ENDO VII family nuclease [Bacillota bacterium]|nr:HNH/ENDO VII family nuclease [Bacillota bacterium]